MENAFASLLRALLSFLAPVYAVLLGAAVAVLLYRAVDKRWRARKHPAARLDKPGVRYKLK